MINAAFIKTAWDECVHVTDVGELQRLYRQRDVRYPVAWDTETTGLHYGVPNVYMEAGDIVTYQDYPVVFGISMAWIVASEYVSEGNGLVVAWGRRPSRLFEVMEALLAEDFAVSRAQGQPVKPPWRRKLQVLAEITGQEREDVQQRVIAAAEAIQVVEAR